MSSVVYLEQDKALLKMILIVIRTTFGGPGFTHYTCEKWRLKKSCDFVKVTSLEKGWNLAQPSWIKPTHRLLMEQHTKRNCSVNSSLQPKTHQQPGITYSQLFLPSVLILKDELKVNTETSLWISCILRNKMSANLWFMDAFNKYLSPFHIPLKHILNINIVHMHTQISCNKCLTK